MAQGRFVSSRICRDKRVHDLSDDTSRLGFTWLITHLDCEGRVDGDPAIVKSLVFPRREDITAQQMEAYIQEWANTGMVVWYESHGDRYIWYPNFEDHQIGLRKDRESPSRIPPPPDGTTPESLRSDSGKNRVKLIKVNVSEGITDTNNCQEENCQDPPDREESDLSKMSALIANKAGLLEFTGGPDKWYQGISRIVEIQPEEVDIDTAIKFMDKEHRSITGPWSLVNPIMIAKGQRERGAGGKNGSTRKSQRRTVEI